MGRLVHDENLFEEIEMEQGKCHECTCRCEVSISLSRHGDRVPIES